MGLPKKLAVGAAAGVVPFLVGQLPAMAAVAEDSVGSGTEYTHENGDRLLCFLQARHRVDTDTGNLDVEFITCRGTLDVTVRYVDVNGEALTTSTNAIGEVQRISLHNVGRTAVTADYRLEIADCASNCTHTLQTKTK